MRVTSNAATEAFIARFNSISSRQLTLQGQVSSGQRLTNAADDPLASGQVLNLRDQSVRLAQYQKNIQTNQEFAHATQGAIQSLQKIMNRAQEIAVSADGLDAKEDLQKYAAEVDGLIQQALQTANTKYRGEYLLAGTKTDTTPFTARTGANSSIISIDFNGNTTPPQSEISPNTFVSSRVPGANTTGSGERGLLADSSSGSDLFAHLIALRDQLASGDVQTIQNSTRPLLAKDEENVLFHVAQNGALQSHLDSALSSAKDEALTVESGISSRTDTDMATTIVRLTQQQTNYQAALQSAGSIMNLNLLSFLR